jgi:Kdo2-lipid IVA lauroyltransferase/acyltransferase
MVKQKKKISIKHRIEYLIFMAFVMMVKLSPLFLIKLNRHLLCFLFGKLSNRHHGIVTRNLRLAYPNESEEYIETLRDNIYRHFASIFTEIIYMFVKSNPEKILKPIEVNNLKVLENVLEKKKGVILFSGHFGNWELVPYILNRKLDKCVNSIARAMDNPLVENKVKRFREYMGSSVIYKKNSLRTMLNRFKNNEIVFILIDQHTIRREGVEVQFFGEPANAVPSVSQLHLRKDIPVVPVFIHYEKDKIVLEVMDEINAPKTDNIENDIRNLTQRCTAIIEEKIRQYPEQWFWFHDRWKAKRERKNDETGNQKKEECES